MSDDKAATGFLRRWSRRKLAPSDLDEGGRRRGTSPPVDDHQELAVPEDLMHLDLEALDFSSDYRRLMKADVPVDLRTKALRALWSSHETISRPDDLDDYLEDFSEQAMALPPELAKSAYVIGRGFWDGEAHSEPADPKPQHPTDAAFSEPRTTDDPELTAETELSPEPAEPDRDATDASPQTE